MLRLRYLSSVPFLFLGRPEYNEDQAAHGVHHGGDPEDELPVLHVILAVDDDTNYHGSHKPHGVA